MEESEEELYDSCTLKKHRTDSVHERLKKEAEIRKDLDDIDELTAGEWRSCADTISHLIWRQSSRFKQRCRSDEWDIDPTGDKARKRAKVVALKEAENGN